MDTPTPHTGPPISFGPSPAPRVVAPVPRSDGHDDHDDHGARALAVVVLVLGGLVTAIDLVAVAVAVPELRSSAGAGAGGSVVPVLDGAGVTAVALSVAAWVATALWLDAERRRLRGPFRHGTAAGLLWWVVPLANLVKPFRVVEEVHRAAVPSSRRVWLGAWWATWIGAGVTALAADSAFATSGHGDQSLPVIALLVMSSALLAVSYWFWVQVVWRTSRA